jgi:N-acetylmuramoyl-L-alanine amidase
MVQRNLKIIGLLLGALMLFAPFTPAQAKDFVLVIDAGHGGHDAGAIGQFSQEKNINLKVALAVGKLIEANCSDVRVIYTRKTDVFIPLGRRAEIANEAKANLFLSIHTNSLANSKTYTGASTWTLGLAKSDANLDVAKKENSVILYENDYKTKYAGFDPNSSESYIIFEFMQDKYMKESVHFASIIQNQFRGALRPDRGVHQAGFLVLKASAMPSVLVELGFISTPSEESYLNSDDGVNALSQSIYRAFTLFKREQDIKHTGKSVTIVPPAVKVKPLAVATDSQNATVRTQPTERDSLFANSSSAQANSENTAVIPAPHQTQAAENKASGDSIFFKLQILAVGAKLSDGDDRLKALSNVECVFDNGLYKYFCGASTSYNDVFLCKKSLDTRFPDSFIVAYQGSKKIDVNEAIRRSKKRRG